MTARTRSHIASTSLTGKLACFTTGAMLLIAAGCGGDGPNGPEAEAWLEIRGQRISVEIVDTPAKRSKGLGERDSLAWDHGMYFEYPEPAFQAFWMKGMRFSIDIIWLRDGRIVGFETNVPFEKGGNGPTVRSRELSDAVLEVPAGYSVVRGWRIGDRVHIERIKAN